MRLVASVLHLDRRAVKALRLTDPYSLHRVIYSLYQDDRTDLQKNSSQPSGILYADQGGDIFGRRVLMLATREPESAVDGSYGAVTSRPVPGHFLGFDKYRFRVVVNPVRRDAASRKLIPIRERSEIIEWFAARAESRWGFSTPGQYLHVNKIEVLRFNDKHQHRVTLAQASIQGQLLVTDRSLFQASFAQGLGRGRAFGCGLLQIAPLIENPFE
jgi:CRISPR system Cascade subunit CasE